MRHELQWAPLQLQPRCMGALSAPAWAAMVDLAVVAAIGTFHARTTAAAAPQRARQTGHRLICAWITAPGIGVHFDHLHAQVLRLCVSRVSQHAHGPLPGQTAGCRLAGA